MDGMHTNPRPIGELLDPWRHDVAAELAASRRRHPANHGPLRWFRPRRR